MVVVGDYSVRLVNAETKEPFKEHDGPDGKTYAEVEPNMEYFIEVEIVGGDSLHKARFEFTVDGHDLGYYKCIWKGKGKKYNGLWSRKDSIVTTKALSFRNPKFINSSNPLDLNKIIGTVKVGIFEAISEGMKDTITQNCIPEPLSPTSVTSNLNYAEKKKVLRSGEGSYSMTSTTPKQHTRYLTGAHLKTITIHYCTAVGLIEAGVLPEPSEWAWARMKKPWKRPSSSGTLAFLELIPTPKKIKRAGVVEDGVTVLQPQECEIFDLSVLPSDDDSDVNL